MGLNAPLVRHRPQPTRRGLCAEYQEPRGILSRMELGENEIKNRPLDLPGPKNERASSRFTRSEEGRRQIVEISVFTNCWAATWEGRDPVPSEERHDFTS